MPSAREDYFIRLLRELGAALGRLRGRMAGAPNAEDADAVRAEAEAAVAELLGPQAPLLRQLDPTTAANLLGDVRRAALWVALLRVQADAERALGREEAAGRVAARAAALDEAARRRWGEEYAPL